MFWVIPWFAVAGVVFFAAIGSTSAPQRGQAGRRGFGDSVALAAVAIAVLVGSVVGAAPLGSLAVPILGLAFGLLGAAAVSAFDETLDGSEWLPPIGAAVAVALLSWLRRDNPLESARVLLGSGVGAAAGASWLAIRTRGSLSGTTTFAVLALFGAAASILGSLRLDGRATVSGAVIGMMAVVCLAVSRGLRRLPSKLDAKTSSLIGVALFALALYGSAQQYFKIPEMGWLALLGVAGAASTAWLIPEEQPGRGSWRTLGAAILWLAVATVGFAGLRGFGMSVAALAGLGTLAILGSRAALPAMAPLLAFVLFRVFRELQPDAARALDIGQHYGLVGVFFGWLVLTAIGEWLASRQKTGWVSGFALVLGLAGLLGMGTILLGAKGTVGLVVGLASAPLLAALQGRTHAAWTVAGCALSGALCIAYRNLLPLAGMEKPDKIRLLAWMGVVVVVLLAMAGWFGRGGRLDKELA